MKKIIPIVALILAFLMIFTACADKNTVEEEPYAAQTIDINTVQDLAGIRNYLGRMYSNYTFSLKADLDLSDIKQWSPIGTSDAPFSGTFLGNGHTVANLTYVAINDKNEPAYDEDLDNVGLFGYTKDTSISDLKLENIDIRCYSKGDYFYAGGLVAYNIGASAFNNIEINGSIILSNIYTYSTTYGLDGKVQDEHSVTCDTTQYIGGVAAYSSGNSTFSSITADIDINNQNYRAVYEKVYSEKDGEKTVEREGYNVRSSLDALMLPEQTIAGGVGGFIKNGADVTSVSVTGNITATAKSVYASGAVGVLMEGSASEINVSDIDLNVKVSSKAGIAGGIALLDSSAASKIVIENIKISAEPISNSVKNISAGGIVSYCYDGAVLTKSSVSGLYITSTIKDKIQFGGVSAVIRDAEIAESEATGEFYLPGRQVDKEDYVNTAAVVYAVYGNSAVKGNAADIDITLSDDGAVSVGKNDRVYGTDNTTIYVNGDGKHVGRFARAVDVKNYIEVFITSDNAGNLTAVYYDRDGTERATLNFTVNESQYLSVQEGYLKYLSAYYSHDIGLLNPNGTVLEIEGESFGGYVRITGVPIIENNSAAA